MAQVVSGNTVSSSAQLGADVVTAPAILDGEVKTAEILNETILSEDIKDGEIKNADISATAGIVDTKLAQITTADKVHGSSIGNLASIPAGAGVIPSANLPSLGSRITSDATNVTTTNPGNNVEVALYSMTVPANTLSTGNTIRGKIYISAEGWASAGTNSVRVKYGATTILTFSIAGNTMTTGWLEFEIIADGSTSAQYAMGMGYWGAWATVLGTSAIDSTSAQTLAITFIATATNPGDTVTFGGATLNKDA